MLTAPFYREILNFKPSDYILKPFKAHFFHVNARHHSLAFIDTGKNGIHHLMVELCYLDDVGQGYDLALRQPEMIGTTLGRHINDHVTSFYANSPSKFLVEYGWGGRTIDPAHCTPHERTEGPSLWGHDRLWLTELGREEARARSMSLMEITRARRIFAPGGKPTCKRAKSDNSEPGNSRSVNCWHRHCDEPKQRSSPARITHPGFSSLTFAMTRAQA